MPPVSDSLLSRKNLHEKRKSDNFRLPPMLDLEFYKYNFLTFIV